jgi:hypothetical protein
MSETSMAEAAETESGLWGSSDRIELIATIALAIATILTAWSAFQAGKWGGMQAINFSEAGTARTESTRFDTQGGQLTQIDVAMYIDWVSALVDDIESGAIPPVEQGAYEPTRGTISGFLYLRFREEFLPAVDAWIRTDPTNNANAPPTPFTMKEYTVAASDEADRLATVADEKALEAREANQNGDNYVLTMVLFASVLFFAGVSSKMNRPRNRMLVLGFGLVTLTAGIAILVSLPILT